MQAQIRDVDHNVLAMVLIQYFSLKASKVENADFREVGRSQGEILTTLTRDIQGEKFIEDASVSHEIQCILILTTQI